MIKFIPVKFIVALIFVLGLIAYFVFDHFDKSSLYNTVSKAIAAVTLIIVFVDSTGTWRFIWKLHTRWFNENICPDLQGTYEGKLISSWNGGTEIPNAKLIIKQTLFRITVKQITGESHSYSKIADIIRFDYENKLYKLYYIYLNEPRDSVQDRSLPHSGAADLRIIIGKNISLEGRYFNDPKIRSTTGEMHFQRISKDSTF